ncbi:hypothetical protein AA313_de0201420 [Arthrobotrys entomopaga]|nr:hypothetical protein AA313_de0201420 [Arthrobotrys entomopaga]
MSIVKCGDVITYKNPSISSAISSASSEQSSPRTILPGYTEDQNPEWSPSRPSPQARPKNPHFSFSDLDGVVISDSDSDDAQAEADKDIPQTALSPSKPSPKKSTQSQDKFKVSKLPRSARPKRDQTISPLSALKQENAPKKVTSKIPVSITPIVALQFDQTSPMDGFDSSPGSGETSPIKRLLNNKASRLRTKSNLNKISCYEEPKPHLDFDFGSPPKSLVVQRPRDTKEEDAIATYELIDSYFQSQASDGEKYLAISEGAGTKSEEDIPSSSPMQTPPVLNQESPRQYGNLGPSSLRFPMDEETQIQLAWEQNILPIGPVCKDHSFAAHTSVPRNSEHPLGDLIGQYTFKPQQQGCKKAGPTKIVVSEPKDGFDPTILSVKIGPGGLIINLECTGDEIVEKVQ